MSRATWLPFTGVPGWCVVLHVRCSRQLGSCSPPCPFGVLCCVCGVLGHFSPVHRCACLVCSVACTVSWATWLLFTVVPARCVVLFVRCPEPPSSCSPECPLFCCACAVQGQLAPVDRCARSVCCGACAVSWATWLLFSAVLLRCVVLRVRCAGPLGSCSLVCPLGALRCLCGVLGHLAPVHRTARSSVAHVVSKATWLPFTGVPAQCVVVRVRCPGPLGSCSPPCSFGVLCCVCGVLGHVAPVHRSAHTSVLLHVQCPGLFGSCSPVYLLGVWCCVCRVLGHLAPVHQCACLVCCVACTVSWATWLLFTGVPARCVLSGVRCPGTLGSSSPLCPLGALRSLCGVLGHLASVHRCARSSNLLHVPCPGPLGSCSPVCLLGVLCCVCGVLGHLAPVHRCACSVRCFACAVSGATWVLFTGVPARWAMMRVRCPGPLVSCSPVCLLGVL